jgi:hypothetical protein
MSSSSWKDYLDPQIATRNRWADHSTHAADVAEARKAAPQGAGSRGLAAAAAVAFTVAVVVLFFVVALHSSTSEPLVSSAPAAPAQHSAPAAPAEHSTTADAAEHSAPTVSAGGGGGGHAVAQ